MSDTTRITGAIGELTIRPSTNPEQTNITNVQDGYTQSFDVDAAALLAALDAANPAAMRAYLRETTEREAITVNVHAVEPDSADLARRIKRVLNERIDAVPEAESPEDVDEQPDRDDPIERAQIDRAWALERAHHLFPSAPSLQAVKVAAWIIGTDERDEVLNMAGEVIGR